MEIKDLIEFVDWENKRVDDASGKNKDELRNNSILKIGEEYGELINEYLKLYGWQRKGKMLAPRKEIEQKMNEEFIDLILVSLLFSRRLGINVEEELIKKIDKIKLREY